MGLFDSFRAMLGISAESNATTKADPENLFGMSTAYLTMEADLRFDSADETTLCFSSVDSTDFTDIVDTVGDTLTAGSEETGTEFSRHADGHGYNWVVLANDDPEDLVMNVHFVADNFIEHDYGSHLLATLFGFECDGDRTYWIYSFRRGAYYPFAPQGTLTRNQSLEFKLKSVPDDRLEVEDDESYWYPLWLSIPNSHPWD